VIRLRKASGDALPAELLDHGTDLRYPAALVEAFMAGHSRPGDLVFDPFAGFGTTLAVAEAMGRRAAGIERDSARVTYARARLRDASALVCGDARDSADHPAGPIGFSMTSPPYMRRDDPTDPFAGYQTAGRGYQAYLSDIRTVYALLAERMAPGAVAVVEVSNLKHPTGVTPLAWDIAGVIATVLRFEGEVIVDWEPTYAYGYDHSYCLVFSAP
jgi:hypothetical protein